METATPAEEIVAAEVDVEIGSAPAAAQTNPDEAIRWFEIAELEAAGFHAFCRLPNDFQHKDIREKAMAAKARKRRQLRHPDTDAYDALEGDMEQIAEGGEAARQNLVFELLMLDVHRDRTRAVAELAEDEEWQHTRQDQERFRSLSEMDEGERNEDEWQEIIEHLGKYAEAVNAKVAELQEPRKQALEGLDLPDLIDKVRDMRVDAEARRAFNDTYAFWQMYVGTLKIPANFDPDEITSETLPRERMFATEADLRDADSLVVSCLQSVFDELEGGLSTLTSGNS